MLRGGQIELGDSTDLPLTIKTTPDALLGVTGVVQNRTLKSLSRAGALRRSSARRLLRTFMTGLDAYVGDGIGRKAFRPTVVGKTVALGSTGNAFWEGVELGNGLIAGGSTSPPPAFNSHFKLALPLLDRVLLGEVCWEDTHIGYQCEASQQPLDFHNGDIVRWMCMFGYFYVGRIAPELRRTHGL